MRTAALPQPVPWEAQAPPSLLGWETPPVAPLLRRRELC